MTIKGFNSEQTNMRKIYLILLGCFLNLGCSSTTNRHAACDFIQGGDNNIEIRDGRKIKGIRDRDRERSLHNDNFYLDVALGLANMARGAASRSLSDDVSHDTDCDLKPTSK